MQEGSASEIELQEMKGETLQLLVAFMYGKIKPRKLTQAQLVSLFLAADKHQVLGLARCYSRHHACKSVHAHMLEFWKHAVCYKLAPKCTSIMIGRDPAELVCLQLVTLQPVVCFVNQLLSLGRSN